MVQASGADRSALFVPVGKRRLFESVLDQLEALIHEGKLGPGDQLPSERSLSETLQVSRPSLREALRVLEALDIIRVRTGVGVAGGTTISDQLGPTISRLMRLYMALGHFDLDDVLHTRRLLEVEAARLAAVERTDEQLAGMERLLAEMDAAAGEQAEYIALDSKFHLVVALASGNSLLAHLMGSMRDAVTEQLAQPRLAKRSWAKLAAHAQANNTALLEALRAGDPDAAAAAIDRQAGFYADV